MPGVEGFETGAGVMLAVLGLGIAARVVEHFPFGLGMRARLPVLDLEVRPGLGEVIILETAVDRLDGVETPHGLRAPSLLARSLLG
ncbi:hypothetical protein sS8_3928 [Methylocaldum marinum]|uniref:Uncharacterized protein n=1 Tax=Methylocaldum marinum TaxID=1432792 RepID=A0A250KW31_9GAMM|nr:hypothetical protein sS8_3928 [Methylocaldum marinum]